MYSGGMVSRPYWSTTSEEEYDVGLTCHSENPAEIRHDPKLLPLTHGLVSLL
jgi:hypothetical protein